MDIYLSFLGRGSKDPQTNRYSYRPARYSLDGRNSTTTEFVQVAEMELLGGERFDKVIIIQTPTSRDDHFKKLAAQLRDRGVRNVLPVVIAEDFEPASQWAWFEQLLPLIEPGSRLIVDLTHGFRVIPIVFSTAIHFLQRAKDVTLEAVYYGAFDVPDEIKPIVNMRDFYTVNLWADAVTRLVDEADADQLIRVSSIAPGFQSDVLNQPDLLEELSALTASIKNVEVHGIAGKAAAALDRIEQYKNQASTTARLLLDLIVEKYSTLAVYETDRYSKEYFQIQLNIIRLLASHGLFMQAFTAMREMVGSIGMTTLPGIRFTNSEGRGKRRYADIFIRMVQYDESMWDFQLEKEQVNNLKPLFDQLQSGGYLDQMRLFLKDLVKIRNGFDHAWCSSASTPEDIPHQAQRMIRELEKLIERLVEHGILK